MTRPENPSRRAFLARTSGAAGSGWLALQWPAILAAASAGCARRDSASGYANISEPMASTLEAMAGQIIPSDEKSPGAREAGVIWFIDQWLGGGGQGMVPMLREGAGDLDTRSGGQGAFARLPFDQQKNKLEEIQDTGFFAAVRFLTLVGMFALPVHGGNQEWSGWKLIGFEHQFAWSPPFGHYDQAYPADAEGEGEA